MWRARCDLYLEFDSHVGTTRPTHRPSLKWQRSAPTQRRAPRVLSSGALRARCSVCGSTAASSAAPAGISSEFTASYLRLRSSLSCLIVRPCSHVAGATSAIGTILQVCPPTCPGPAQSIQCRSALAGSVDACAAEQSRRTLATGGNDLRRQHSNGCVDLLAPRYLAGALRACV